MWLYWEEINWFMNEITKSYNNMITDNMSGTEEGARMKIKNRAAHSLQHH